MASDVDEGHSTEPGTSKGCSPATGVDSFNDRKSPAADATELLLSMSPAAAGVVKSSPKKRATLDVDALWRKKRILMESRAKKVEDVDETPDSSWERPTDEKSQTRDDDTVGKASTRENGEKSLANWPTLEQTMRRQAKSRRGDKRKKQNGAPVGTASTNSAGMDVPLQSAVEDDELSIKRDRITIITEDGIEKSFRSDLKSVRPTSIDDGSDHGDLVDSYSPSASQYVNEFTSIEYPISQHIATTVAPGTYTVYAPDTSNYAAYYQYSGNVQQSPTQSYMLHSQGAQSPASVDDDGSTALGHTTRASPATIQWLLDNYETADGTSLPRCTLYDHYKRHCSEHRLDPVNAASFGKLIRSVFLGLRTRRLGTRGNSKYHYYGIRIKPDSTLNRQGILSSGDPYSESVNSVVTSSRYNGHGKRNAQSSASSSHSNSASPTYSSPAVAVVVEERPTTTVYRINGNVVADEDRASLGEGEVPVVTFPRVEQDFQEAIGKLGLDISHVQRFVTLYQQNCHNVLHYVKQLQFEEVELCWVSFWQAEIDELDEEEFMQERLTQKELYALCDLPQMQDYILEVDLAFYQVIVDVLVPNVLMSQMTSALTQQCRNFAKTVDLYMRKALHGVPELLVRKKLQAVKYMSQGLKRYTSLNHLAQAARAVLQKQEQVTAMYNDYIRVDMTQVHEQAGWTCHCDSLMVQHINNAFKVNLQKMVPMEQWAEWLESIVDQILAKYHDKPADVIAEVGKQFLLNWSMYTSMVIRDLTLRSAASFGSFHLIRLLADDYMFYLIESRIAKASNQPLITVIQQEKDTPLFNEMRQLQPGHEYIDDDQEDFEAKPLIPTLPEPTFETGKGMAYHENRENLHVDVEETDGQNILCI